jgi:anti-sigma B factor antagonist
VSTLLRTEVLVEPNGVVVIRCIGELDLSTMDELVEAIEWSQTPDLLVLRIDTVGLEFIDSSGLRCLVTADKRCQETGVLMELVVGPTVQRLLDLVGLADYFNVQPDVVAHAVMMTVHTLPKKP